MLHHFSSRALFHTDSKSQRSEVPQRNQEKEAKLHSREMAHRVEVIVEVDQNHANETEASIRKATSNQLSVSNLQDSDREARWVPHSQESMCHRAR